MGGGGSSSSLEQILPIVSFKDSDGDVKQFTHNRILYIIKSSGGYYSYYYPYKPLTEFHNDEHDVWITHYDFPVFWEIDLGRENTNITKICLNTACKFDNYSTIAFPRYYNLIHNLELYSSLNGIDYNLIASYSHPKSTITTSMGDPIELNVDYFKSRYIRFKFLDSYYSNQVGFGNLRIYRKPDDKIFIDKNNYIYGCKNNT